MKTVGVIADTHGLLRPEATAELIGCDALIHAGDVGKPEILDELAAIAPLTVIRGNVDGWADSLPDTEVLEIEGCALYILHDLKQLDLNPVAARFDAVISAHSHKPERFEKAGVLYLNPGSAGPRRFKLPVSLAKLKIAAGKIEAELVTLAV